MGTEFELKYRADGAALGAIREAFPGEYAAIDMETTYYDTPGGEISRRYWTLRHRREGDERVCTLKTPAAGNARGEWEVRGCGIGQALPELARLSGEALLKELREEDLMVACGAKFTRLALEVKTDRFTAELALDEGVLLGGGRKAPLCEVELELKSGSVRALTEYAKEFAARFGLEPEPLSKFARARALAEEG